MQVTANEFVMVICTLLVVIVGLCGYAFRVHRELVHSNTSLQNLKEQLPILEAEVATLKKVVDEQKANNSDAFNKPINQPKKFIA